MESKAGMVRRKLFVPRPSVWSLENFSAGLPDRCLELATKPHCRKDTEERGLFSEDRAALLPLPGKRFDVGRVAAYEGRPVRCGRARGRHRRSADRANAGREPVVGLRALEARGPRLVGQAPGDPSSGVRPGRHEQRGCVLSSAGVPFYRGWLSGLPVNCLPGYRRLVSSGFGCFVIA